MHQCQLSKQWISRARLSKIKQADSLREETIKAHVMGLPCTHRLKRSALINKGTKRQTRHGNNKHVVFLKLQPELKKKKNIYIYMITLKLSKPVLLLAALTFIIWTENNKMQNKENETREALCSDVL